MEQFVAVEKISPKFWLSKRFFIAILMFTLHLSANSVNLNIAIVAMTSNKTITSNNETIKEPEFNWDSKTKNFLLGVSSYGFLVLLFGTPVTVKFGSSRTIGISLAVISVMIILSPFTIRLNFYLYVAVKISEGLFEGLIYVSIPEFWAQWAPIPDRSKLISIGYWGSLVGWFVVYPICGYSIYNYGWPSAFYITGISTIICSFLWLYFVPNTPTSDKWISKEEMIFINENKTETVKPKHFTSTLKHIVTSKCVWASGFCKFTFSFGFTFVNTCLPMYIKDITNDEIDMVGLLSALPNALCAFTFPFCGYILDGVQSKRKLTPTQIHKLFLFSGYVISAMLMTIVALFRVDFTVTMLFFTIFSTVSKFCILVIHISFVFMAPQCASMVGGFTELFYSVGYFGGPMVVGFLVTDHKPEQWNQYILLIAIVSLICGIFYLVFGSSEEQSWSYTKNNTDQSTNETLLNNSTTNKVANNNHLSP